MAARLAIKALAVTALVCLIFDRTAIATDVQPQPTGNFDTAKNTMSELLDSAKQSMSNAFEKLKEGNKDTETTKKIESYIADTVNNVKKYSQDLGSQKGTEQVSGFFNSALSKLKNVFSSTKSSTNPDDHIKQEAIKAFDDYAEKHPSH